MQLRLFLIFRMMQIVKRFGFVLNFGAYFVYPKKNFGADFLDILKR